MFELTITEAVLNESRSITKSNIFVGAAKISISEDIASSAEDEQIDLAIPVANVRACFVLSSHDMTVKTNSDSVPDDTLELVGGVPYVWHHEHYASFLFGTDIEALYVTHGESTSGEVAMLEIELLYDPTV